MTPGPPILAITQRVSIDPATGERRDALDQRWADFAAILNVRLLPLPNRPDVAVSLVRDLGCAGLILSGGNNIGPELRTVEDAPTRAPDARVGDAPERDATESALLAYSIQSGLPVLGVCRGFQALGLFHGGAVRRIDMGHVATRHPLTYTTAFPTSIEGRPADANSYHDWGMLEADIPPSLQILATAGDVVEMARHVSLPHLGVMWHPEREAPFRDFDLQCFRDHFAMSANA